MKTRFLTPFVVLQLFAAPAQAKSRIEEKDTNIYSSFGKRDPFRPPDRGDVGRGQSLDPARKYRLESYHLRAILRVAGRPQAMFEGPDGKAHVMVEGDRVGSEGAKISRIVDSEVIVTDRGTDALGKETILEKVISLPNDSDSRFELGGAEAPKPAETQKPTVAQKPGDADLVGPVFPASGVPKLTQ